MFIKLLSAAVTVALAVVVISFLLFLVVFFVPRIKKPDPDVLPVPKGKEYKPYHPLMKKWIVEGRAKEHTDYYIKSHDGLTLHAKYFEYAKGAPTEIMFHGYRGSAERDLSGGLQRCFALGRNVLLVDQRTTCKSDGHIITFGIKEHRDCIAWAEFAAKEFGSEVPLLLTGISMGASTVLMAAAKPLPSNVKGVLADCGFTTAKDIIKKCCNDLHIPGGIIYPFVKLGAKLFGGFDLDEYSALEAVQKCTLPVYFIHGESDNFVPCYMSRQLYDNCAAPKMLVTVEGAAHGLSYVVDNKKYFETMTKFFTDNGVKTHLLENVM